MFIEKLGNVSIKEIIRTAKERKGGAVGYAEAMVLAYNNQRTNTPLPIQRLYDRALLRGSLQIEESLKEAFDRETQDQTEST